MLTNISQGDHVFVCLLAGLHKKHLWLVQSVKLSKCWGPSVGFVAKHMMCPKTRLLRLTFIKTPGEKPFYQSNPSASCSTARDVFSVGLARGNVSLFFVFFCFSTEKTSSVTWLAAPTLGKRAFSRQMSISGNREALFREEEGTANSAAVSPG